MTDEGLGPAIVWLTGLSGAGKSTIAAELMAQLSQRGAPAFNLDGDVLRQGLCRDLGFTAADRAENVRRAGEVARIVAQAGMLAICTLTSPTRADRDAVRQRAAPYRFLEVHIDASLAVCEARDPKGLYARYRAGEVKQMVGVDLPYEAPLSAEVVLTPAQSPSEAAEAILRALGSAGVKPHLIADNSAAIGISQATRA